MFGIENEIPSPPPIDPKDLVITKFELEHGLFTDQQLEALRKACGKTDGATREYTNRLKDSLKQINGRAVRQIADANIRYASQYATEELNRRKTNR